jgi:hypothetical protein
MKITFNGKIKDGKMTIINRKSFDDYINSLPDKDVLITIEKKIKKRSNHQNAYYYGVVLKIVRQGLIDQGFDNFRNDESVHELLKYRFLKVDESNPDGLFVERIKSTTELSTSQFMDYIAEIQRWASEFLNVYIPEPNEELMLKL